MIDCFLQKECFHPLHLHPHPKDTLEMRGEKFVCKKVAMEGIDRMSLLPSVCRSPSSVKSTHCHIDVKMSENDFHNSVNLLISV